MCCCAAVLRRKFELWLKVNRWVYDATRGLHIDTKNPQKARSVNAPFQKVAAVEDLTGDSRFEDGGQLRSTRIQLKKFAHSDAPEEELNGGNEEGENDQQQSMEPSPSKSAGKRAKKRQSIRSLSPAPTWTKKLEAAFQSSVKRWKGKASNGGIAWVHVMNDLNMSKHHVTVHWKKLQQEATAAPDARAAKVTVCLCCSVWMQ